MAFKPCNRCGQDIGFRKEGERTIPINPDGTPHHCSPKPAEGKTEEDSVIGIYRGLAFKRISIERKDKRILSSGITAKLSDYLAHPETQLKAGMKVKVIFAKDGNADTIEICPDQPPAEQQPPQETKPPAETCTSPAGAAPARSADPQKREFPDRDMLLSMCSSSDGYWRAKFYLDLRRCEEIRQQAEHKNWQEAISLAIAYQQTRPIEGETVFESAIKIHNFIAAMMAGVSVS